MSLEVLHRARRDGARPDSQRDEVIDVGSALYVAVWAHAEGDVAVAREFAGKAVAWDDESEFARLFAQYVSAEATGTGASVYDSPAAFGAFIRGGGNVALYEATVGVLRESYRWWRPGSVLDVGAGDGLALVPAVSDQSMTVDVVEPSAQLAAQTAAGLRGAAVRHRVFGTTVQDFARSQDGSWDVVQSTFALQSLPPHDRREVLRWIAARTSTLVLVEFDVDEVADPFEPSWFLDSLARMERGVREYVQDRDLVALGFILPVVLGHFLRRERTNYECSIRNWVWELAGVGFTDITHRRIQDYWWRPAYVVWAR